jgi:hypothetical protein
LAAVRHKASFPCSPAQQDLCVEAFCAPIKIGIPSKFFMAPCDPGALTTSFPFSSVCTEGLRVQNCGGKTQLGKRSTYRFPVHLREQSNLTHFRRLVGNAILAANTSAAQFQDGFKAKICESELIIGPF